MFENVHQATRAVISKVFETMFYLWAEPCDGGQEQSQASEPPPSFLRGEIGFEGKFSGALRLSLSTGLARKMAINFMGLEKDEVSESQMMDVVSETCNTTCGNLLSHLDKKSAYALTPPRTQPISAEQLHEESQPGSVLLHFDVEGERLRVEIQLES